MPKKPVPPSPAQTVTAENRPSPRLSMWRVGRKVSINLYDGERPVCQCHHDFDAARIVEAVNLVQWLEQVAPETIATWRIAHRRAYESHGVPEAGICIYCDRSRSEAWEASMGLYCETSPEGVHDFIAEARGETDAG